MNNLTNTGYAGAESPYPYDKPMGKKEYEKKLGKLHIELAKLQKWISEKAKRVVLFFEGRDAAGKGGTIKRITEVMNPRIVKTIALEKPSDIEKTQWYIQRYMPHFPSAGHMTIFDRSPYNRAGVERVMGFCTPKEYHTFLRHILITERMLQEDGIILMKFWFSVGRQEQINRMNRRETNPVKRWKISVMDPISLEKFDEYTLAKQAMFDATDTPDSPWIVVRNDDKKRGRLAAISKLLSQFDYDEKIKKHSIYDTRLVGSPAEIYS